MCLYKYFLHGTKKMTISILLVLFIVALSFVVLHYFYSDPLGIGKLLARKSFPEAAKELGLHLRSTTGNQIGNYAGKYKNYFITIEFESARVQLNMKPISGLSLSTSYDRQNFSTKNDAFDRFFSERIAPSPIAKKIQQNEELLQFVEYFQNKWQKRLLYFAVNEDYIKTRLKYGNGHYIPGKILKKFLSDLVRLTDLIQKNSS